MNYLRYILVSLAMIGCAKIPPINPVPDPAPEQYDLLLTVTGISKSQVRFAWEPKSFNWPSQVVKVPVCATVEMYRANGRGGKFDWIRVGGQSIKGLENIHNGYGVWGSVGIPKSGERVTFRWVDIYGRKRSNDAEVIWP